MKNSSLYYLMNYSLWLVILGISPLAAEEKINTVNIEKPSLSNQEENITCSKELFMTRFPKPLVKMVLIKNQFPADQAEAIADELSKKDQDIIKLVEKKASQSDPNPFKDLSQREAAVKIVRESLYDVFAESLQKYGVKDETKIHQLLDDIQEAKGKLFVECIRRENVKKDEINK